MIRSASEAHRNTHTAWQVTAAKGAHDLDCVCCAVRSDRLARQDGVLDSARDDSARSKERDRLFVATRPGEKLVDGGRLQHLG